MYSLKSSEGLFMRKKMDKMVNSKLFWIWKVTSNVVQMVVVKEISLSLQV